MRTKSCEKSPKFSDDSTEAYQSSRNTHQIIWESIIDGSKQMSLIIFLYPHFYDRNGYIGSIFLLLSSNVIHVACTFF